MDHLSICSNNQHERDPLDNFCITCHIEILNISQSNVEDYVNQCEQLDQLGIIDEALNCLEMGIQINLSIEDTYNKIGDALRRLNNQTEAYFYYKQGFNIKMKNILLLKGKSDILQKEQRYEEAIICQNLIEDINKNEQKGQKGILFQLLKKDEQAQEEYDQCLKFGQEDQYVIFLNKGTLLGDQMKYEDALKCYDAALKINPNLAEAMNNKGNQFRINFKEAPYKNYKNMKKLQNAMMLHQRLILNMQQL